MVWPYLVAGFVLLAPLTVWGMRRDYRRLGRQGWLGFGLLLVWFFLPHLTLDYAVRYTSPWGPRQYVGLAIAVLAAGVCLAAIVAFASLRKVFTFDHGILTVSGLYRWSRNPQYVGWFLFLLGFAVMWWTWRCWIALVMMAAAIHALVLVEEEHLKRVFGAPYDEFRDRVPRYLGRRRLRVGVRSG